jgi:endonuclease III
MLAINKIDNIFLYFSNKVAIPKTELVSCNNFTLLVAIILSAQSTDVGVNKATASLFKIVKTPKDLQDLGLESLKKHIKSLGLYNNKAKNLIALADILLVKHKGGIPSNLMELEQLPGVGGKTARVFLNCVHAVPVIAVDTHVFRVSKRLGLVKGESIKSVETELNSNIPERWKLHAHNWLILHGRYICKARKPDCLNCPISSYCNYYAKESS